MTRWLLFVVLCLITTILTAQMTFKKRFGSAEDDRAWDVAALLDNSFLIVGSSAGGGLGGEDGMIAKLTSDGTVEWSKAYGGANFDNFYRIYACSDGNYLAVGETMSYGAGGSDIFVVKFDLGGNVLWQQTCGGTGQELSRGICEVSDGYIITGATLSFGNGGYDIFIAKLDVNGNTMWSKVWGTTATDYAGEPIPGAGSDFWVSGYVTNGNNTDGVLMHVDAGGNFLSIRRIGGANSENMLYLTGGGPGLGQSGSMWISSQLQPMLYGLNLSNQLIWANRYLMPSGNYDMEAEGCPDGGFIFSPYSISAAGPDAYLVKTDANGNISWARSHAFLGSGKMTKARPTPDGGYIAVGFSTGAAMDCFVVKTDASGNVQGCCPVDAPITAVSVNPNVVTPSLPSAGGPVSVLAPAELQDFTLTETSLCSGSCCITEAGTMLVQTQSVCINLPATFTHNHDEILESDDLLQFILFTDLNDTLGSIIATSLSPVFYFNPANMETGVTYYIAAIAGDNVGGNVDLNDPCLDISNAAMLIWLPLPEVIFSVANPDVCAGDCTDVMATFTGTAPFTLTYTIPGSGPMTQTFSGNTGTFQVCTPPGASPGSFVLQATELVDANCTCN